MADGLGLWPRTVFANQSVLLAPPTDPARVRGVQDAVQAFRRIAETKSRFLVNNAATEKYLGQVLWEAAGRPDQAGWYADTGLRDQTVIQSAERSDAYVLWGIIPFLKFKESTSSRLEMIAVEDPIMQRLMMTVVVNPEKAPGVNVAGAVALQRYLASAATQGRDSFLSLSWRQPATVLAVRTRQYWGISFRCQSVNNHGGPGRQQRRLQFGDDPGRFLHDNVCRREPVRANLFRCSVSAAGRHGRRSGRELATRGDGDAQDTGGYCDRHVENHGCAGPS